MKKQTVLSVSKTLMILSLFTKEKTELRIKDICEYLNMPASTVHRLLATLEEYDYITQNQINGKYRLGAAAFITGANVEFINVLVDQSLPYMAELSAKYGASTHVAIEQNGHVLCIEKIESVENKVHSPKRGYPHHLHMTSVGKCLLAFASSKRQEYLINQIDYTQATHTTITNKKDLLIEIEKVKRLGYAIDNHESFNNLYCFGAPIFGINMEIKGAISLSITAQKLPENVGTMIEDVKACAHKISSNIQKEALAKSTTRRI